MSSDYLTLGLEPRGLFASAFLMLSQGCVLLTGIKGKKNCGRV